jgi:hypothetical protein
MCPLVVGDIVQFQHDDGTISGSSDSPYRVTAIYGEMFDCLDSRGGWHRFTWRSLDTARWVVVV